MPQQDTFATQLGQAWAQLRQGAGQSAASGFEEILKSDQQHIDALYGLALAQKSLGQISSAQTTLERCLKAVRTQMQADPKVDRFIMLERIVQQRLSEISG